MLKYSDGVEIREGDRVSFSDADGLSGTGTVFWVNYRDVTVQLDDQDPSKGWSRSGTGGPRCWYVSPQKLKRLDMKEVKYPTPAFTQLKGRPEDPYSVGPEGETAGYIARGGGLKYL